MKARVSVLFYPKKGNLNSKGEVPVRLRITVSGKRFEMSTDRMVKPDLWITGSNSVKSGKEESRVLNTYLKNLETNVYKAINAIELAGKEVTFESLRAKIKGTSEKTHTLIGLFNYHNERMKALVGHDFAIGTYKRYVVTIGKVKAFLQHQYKKDDMPITELNHAFVTNFEYYLKTHDTNQSNTAMKYIRNLKKVVNIAVSNEWLDRDPFVRFKCTYKDPNRQPLTQSELDVLMTKELKIYRLEVVRDMFVFSCFTGLAYSDIEQLTPSIIYKGIDGEDWITLQRQKTDTRTSLPILPQAKAIIDKYRNNPVTLNSGKLLPMISNQKTNAFLKEIATLCEIDKNLTYHMARHTFATTVALANGVPIETVSRILGHTSIPTTQIYGKVNDTKVSADMKNLKVKLAEKSDKKKEAISA